MNRSFLAVSRILWLLFGLIVSIVPLLKPLALAAALFGVLASQGVYPGAALARSFQHWQTVLLPLSMVIFTAYWLCVGWLSYQFARGRPLSRLAGIFVVVVAAAFVVVGQPWQYSGKPFVPGPEDLLHIIFLLGLALYASRVSHTHVARAKA
jgi:hypothetical protein